MNLKFFSVLLMLAIFCSMGAVSATTHGNEIFHVDNYSSDDASSVDIDVYNYSNDAGNSSAFSMDDVTVFNGSDDVPDDFNSDDSNAVHVSDNVFSLVIYGISGNVKSAFDFNNLVKTPYDFYQNNIKSVLNIFIQSTINNVFKFLLLDFDRPWYHRFSDGSYFDWGSDSFLAYSQPWGTSF